jgi:hypothetical protein
VLSPCDRQHKRIIGELPPSSLSCFSPSRSSLVFILSRFFWRVFCISDCLFCCRFLSVPLFVGESSVVFTAPLLSSIRSEAFWALVGDDITNKAWEVPSPACVFVHQNRGTLQWHWSHVRRKRTGISTTVACLGVSPVDKQNRCKAVVAINTNNRRLRQTVSTHEFISSSALHLWDQRLQLSVFAKTCSPLKDQSL